MWKKVLIGLIILIAIVVELSLFLTKGLSDVANKQLDAIKKGDITVAYSYTSKDFQNSVSLKSFEKFINQHPMLKNNQKISWGERSFSGSTGILKGNLIANDGGATPIEYQFVKENKNWKILSLIFKPSGIQNPTSSTSSTESTQKDQGEIYQVLISDIQGPNRSVNTAKAVIPTIAPKIYVSVYVLNAKAGVKVNVKMTRVDNGSIVGTNAAKITQNGNVVRDFSFTNVDKTWPAGDYQMDITTSNQQSATVNFKVE
jgi:hypothetical protein